MNDSVYILQVIAGTFLFSAGVFTEHRRAWRMALGSVVTGMGIYLLFAGSPRTQTEAYPHVDDESYAMLIDQGCRPFFSASSAGDWQLILVSLDNKHERSITGHYTPDSTSHITFDGIHIDEAMKAVAEAGDITTQKPHFYVIEKRWAREVSETEFVQHDMGFIRWEARPTP